MNAGRIQGILLDEVYANYYISKQSDKNSYRVIINDQVPADYFVVGMRKGDKTLRRKINEGFKILEEDGTMQKLRTKWFGKAQ